VTDLDWMERRFVCAGCGSTRIGAIQRGIDNWPVAQCYNCGPSTTSGIPEEPGEKRDKALNRAATKPIGSKKAIHAVLRPVVEASQYKPRVKPVEAKPMGMFGD
jgi:hypothetical protein